VSGRGGQRSRVVPPGPPRHNRDTRCPPRTFGTLTKSLTVDHATAGFVDEGGHRFDPRRPHHPVFRYRTPPDTRAFVPRNAGFSSQLSSSNRSPRDENSVFARPSLHPKIPFPAAAVRWPNRSGTGNLERSNLALIWGSIRALRTADPTRPGHHANVRRRCLAVADLRQVL
jgi:hypothetical protein